jgi:adenylate kinase
VYEYGKYDPDTKSHNDVYYDLSQVLGLRYLKGQPRRVPQIIILGPPGSGRGTQAKLIAKKYGLIHISTRSLVKDELQRKPAIAPIISECMNEGKLIPESLVTPLIVQRLQEADCLANGWVLDGFPQNEA